MGSIREVAISRSVSSRTMSAADRQRSWRSANENTCRDHGEVRSGGPKARKQDAGLARKMETRSKVSSRDREPISPQSRGIGPQSRAIGGERGARAENGSAENGSQTHLIGGDSGAEAPSCIGTWAAVQHGIQAMQPGQAAGGNHGQCQMQAYGPQPRMRNRVMLRNHCGYQNPMDKMR